MPRLEANRPGQLVHLLVLAVLAADPGQKLERTAQDHPHAVARVERIVRVLEDHLEPAARLPAAAAAGRDVGRVELDRAAAGIEQADDALRERRLAAPRLAHKPEHLAAADLHVDARHRRHLVSARPVGLHEVVDLEQHPVRGRDCRRIRGRPGLRRDRRHLLGRRDPPARGRSAAAPPGSGRARSDSARRRRTPPCRRRSAAASRGSGRAGRCPCASPSAACSAGGQACTGGAARRRAQPPAPPRSAGPRRGRRPARTCARRSPGCGSRTGSRPGTGFATAPPGRAPRPPRWRRGRWWARRARGGPGRWRAPSRT